MMNFNPKEIHFLYKTIGLRNTRLAGGAAAITVGKTGVNLNWS